MHPEHLSSSDRGFLNFYFYLWQRKLIFNCEHAERLKNARFLQMGVCSEYHCQRIGRQAQGRGNHSFKKDTK
jgi:hypothetical protein